MAAPGRVRIPAFRYSLRTFLLAVLALSTTLGWILHQVRAQQNAAAAIKTLDCRVLYWQDNEAPAGWFERLRMSLEKEPQRDLAIVHANGAPITDADMVHFSYMTHLRELDLSHTKVTPAGLVHLKKLRHLRLLDLNGTDIDDSALDALRELNQLEDIVLWHTRVSVAGERAELQAAVPTWTIYHSDLPD